MRLVLTTPPAIEPLTAAELRARVGIGAEIADATVDAWIKAARQTIDGWSGIGRALITQTWTMYLPCFARQIRIPLAPIQSIASVKYVDVEGDEQTVPDTDYRLVPGLPVYVELVAGKNWPAHRSQSDAVRLAFVAGYGSTASAVPEPIRTAIALRASRLRSVSAGNLFVSEDSVEGVGSKRYVVGTGAGDAIEMAVAELLENYRMRL